MKNLTIFFEKMISNYVLFFAERKWLSVPLFILFSLFIIFLHDTFVQVSIFFTNKLTVSVYNYLILTIAACSIFLLFYLLKSQLSKKQPYYGFKFLYALFTFIFLVIHTFAMLEMYIELIHALLYGTLAFIAFPLFQSYGKTLLFCLPVMFIDEWFQYQIMYKGFVQYFEINDLVLDVLGAGIAFIVLLIYNAPIKILKGSLISQTDVKILFFCILVLIIGFWQEWWVLYSADASENTRFIFNQLENPFAFWQIHPYNKTTYHVLLPIPGLVLLLILCFFYYQIDFYFKIKKYSPQNG